MFHFFLFIQLTINICTSNLSNVGPDHNLSLQANIPSNYYDHSTLLSIEGEITEIPKSILGNKTFIFSMFIILFFIIIFLKITSPEILEDLFNSIRSRKYLLTRFARGKPTLSFNHILLDMLFLLIFSLFIFSLQLKILYLSYIQIFLLITTFFLVKLLLIFLVYKIFFRQKSYNIHITNILSFDRSLGIFLTPIMFIITFLGEHQRNISLNYLGYFIVFIFLFRIIRMFRQLNLVYKYNLFYIFLYLCIFEFSLYIILFREIIKYI